MSGPDGGPRPAAPIAAALSTLGVNAQPAERLARHTSFKIGGPALAFVEPADEEEALVAARTAFVQGIPLMVVGLGSNVLVSDRGFEGIVLSLARACRDIRRDGAQLAAGAGVSLAKVAHTAAGQGLSGVEFAVSIPGTVGGAAVMNAGAHGKSAQDVVSAVRVWDPSRGVVVLPRDAMQYAYRVSRAQREAWVVLEVWFDLSPAPREEILRTMRDYMKHRRSTQPLGEKNAGSMFKNPPGDFAARLIEAAGAKGWREGGASVSTLHANFIANDGTATARDVLALMRRVSAAVQEQFHTALAPEVRWVGPPEGEDGTSWDNLWLPAGGA